MPTTVWERCAGWPRSAATSIVGPLWLPVAMGCGVAALFRSLRRAGSGWLGPVVLAWTSRRGLVAARTSPAAIAQSSIHGGRDRRVGLCERAIQIAAVLADAPRVERRTGPDRHRGAASIQASARESGIRVLLIEPTRIDGRDGALPRRIRFTVSARLADRDATARAAVRRCAASCCRCRPRRRPAPSTSSARPISRAWADSATRRRSCVPRHHRRPRRSRGPASRWRLRHDHDRTHPVGASEGPPARSRPPWSPASAPPSPRTVNVSHARHRGSPICCRSPASTSASSPVSSSLGLRLGAGAAAGAGAAPADQEMGGRGRDRGRTLLPAAVGRRRADAALLPDDRPSSSLAVLVDREAISLRLVAWAAAAILLLSPDSMVGASFQMSFAAVLALVAAYEAARERIRALARPAGHVLGRVLLYAALVCFTTVIATAATTPVRPLSLQPLRGLCPAGEPDRGAAHELLGDALGGDRRARHAVRPRRLAPGRHGLGGGGASSAAADWIAGWPGAAWTVPVDARTPASRSLARRAASGYACGGTGCAGRGWWRSPSAFSRSDGSGRPTCWSRARGGRSPSADPRATGCSRTGAARSRSKPGCAAPRPSAPPGPRGPRPCPTATSASAACAAAGSGSSWPAAATP
jgi:hypothetical protein